MCCFIFTRVYLNKTTSHNDPEHFLTLPSLSFSFQATQRIIEDHRPLVEDLNNTGHELMVLCGEEDEANIKDDLFHINSKYEEVKAANREKLNELDDAFRHVCTEVSPPPPPPSFTMFFCM